MFFELWFISLAFRWVKQVKDEKRGKYLHVWTDHWHGIYFIGPKLSKHSNWLVLIITDVAFWTHEVQVL